MTGMILPAQTNRCWISLGVFMFSEQTVIQRPEVRCYNTKLFFVNLDFLMYPMPDLRETKS